MPFGEKEGRLYRPEAVDRGKKCGCRCPECKVRLIAKCSVAGRFYFAHHRGGECPGGYETALHKMAKQILLDAGRVWLPERDVLLSFPLVFGETLSETLHFEAREVQFASAVSEKRLDNGLTPDVTALLKNDAELHIEILVTHAVEANKSLAIDNVMEIDLSWLSEETVLDPVALEAEVLKSAPRWWHRCSLIDELPKVHTVRDALEARVPGEIKRLERKRAREEAAKRKKERAAQQKEERRQTLIRKKAEAREPFEIALRNLEQVESMGWLTMGDRLAERAKPQLEVIAQRLRFESEKWPTFMDVSVQREWVFKEDRRLWQSAVFEPLILEKQPGYIFSVAQALAYAENATGVRGWATKLSQLKRNHLGQPYNQRKDYELRGVWFLTPAENNAIRSPYAVVLSYLKKLCKRGVLAEERPAKTFRVLASAPDIWMAHEKEQRLLGVRAVRSERGRATLQALLGDVYPEDEKYQKVEQEWQERREVVTQRLDYSVNDANAIAAAGHDTASFCLSCKRHQLPTPINECSVCYSHRVRVVELTEDYLRTLLHRLKCMP